MTPSTGTGSSRPASVLDLIARKRRVVVCVGSGGVGKTTTSAALALRGCRVGLRAIVLTVDPARRLANALGMASMPTHPVRVDLGGGGEGEMWAQMLDTKATFDEVIRRYAPDEKVRDRILGNPFYQKASSHLAGSHEYMAMEQLLMLHESGDYDLIVLDTPPSMHALDFLDAPRRLHDFLDSTSARLLTRASRSMSRRFGLFRMSGVMVRGVGRFIGSDFFTDLLAFIQSFEPMYEGFRARADRTRKLLRSRDSGFVILHAPEEPTLREAERFHEVLAREGMEVIAFIANRVHVRGRFDVERSLAALSRLLVDEPVVPLHDAGTRRAIRGKATRQARNYAFLAAQDSEALERIRGRAAAADPPLPVLTVPHFDEDLHDLSGLARFAGSAVIDTDEPGRAEAP